jgi:hypothetical protein
VTLELTVEVGGGRVTTLVGDLFHGVIRFGEQAGGARDA